MGISLALGTLVGVPLSIFSNLIVKNLGHELIAFSVLGLYAIRLFGYSIVNAPGEQDWGRVTNAFATIMQGL
jgi:hypothetical protein